MRDLNTKIEELEAVGGRKLKSQVAAMESKMIGLEDQLDVANKLVEKGRESKHNCKYTSSCFEVKWLVSMSINDLYGSAKTNV